MIYIILQSSLTKFRFLEMGFRTIRNLFEKKIFERGNADWLSELLAVIKNTKTIHHSTKMTPIEASMKKMKKHFFSISKTREKMRQSTNFQFEKDPFSENAQSRARIRQNELLLLKSFKKTSS